MSEQAINAQLVEFAKAIEFRSENGFVLLRMPDLNGGVKNTLELGGSNDKSVLDVIRYLEELRQSALKSISRASEMSRLQRAEQALYAAGFTRTENGNWKPPLGKPAGPLLDSLDAEREAKNTLAALILDLTGAALPHMPTDEPLRVVGVKAITAALNVMQGRQP